MSAKEVTLPKFYEEFKSFKEAIGYRFDGVDKRFNRVDNRLDAVDKRFDAVDERFDSIEEKLSKHTAFFLNIESKLDFYGDMYVSNKGKIEGLDLRVADLETR